MPDKPSEKEKGTTIYIHTNIRNQLHEIIDYLEKLYFGKPKTPKMTYNDAIAHLLRESKKTEKLAEKLKIMVDEYNNKLKLINKHINNLQLNGQKLKFNVFNIPELNRFVDDPDLEIIRKVKKRGES